MIEPSISFGNRVLPKHIAIFNIPTEVTCPYCDLCKSTCYAKKAERLYPQVLPSRYKNLRLTESPQFADDMAKLIDHMGIIMMRPHEAGDYYNQEYADKWDYIIRKNPHVRFFAYSKSEYRPRERSNYHTVNSLLPDGTINYGSEDYIKEKAKKFHAVICPYQNKGQKVCGSKCDICFQEEYVLFKKH